MQRKPADVVADNNMIGPSPVFFVDGNNNPTSVGGGTQYTDGAAAPAHPTGNDIVFNKAGTMTAVSDTNPFPTSATVTPPANQRVNSQSGDFVAGSIADLVTAVSKLTSIVTLLQGTLTVGGSVAVNTISNYATESGNLAAILADTADIETNTGLLALESGGNLATLVPGVQGWIAASGNGTASQDNALAFAQQVRKIALYNASANNVPLEFDQTSTATSFPIPPGAFWIIDGALCTNVHVFPSATLPINTTSGLYVKGWK